MASQASQAHGSHGPHEVGSLVIDCGSCPVRERRCADCMVTALQSLPEQGLPLDADERAAVTTLVRHGLLGVEVAAGARATAGRGIMVR